MLRYKFFPVIDGHLIHSTFDFNGDIVLRRKPLEAPERRISIGETYSLGSRPFVNRYAFHCATTILDALKIVNLMQGDDSILKPHVLAHVEVAGRSHIGRYKEAWEHMTIRQVWQWNDVDCVAFLLHAATLRLSWYQEFYPDDTLLAQTLEAANLWCKYPTDEWKNIVRDMGKKVYKARDAIFDVARGDKEEPSVWHSKYHARNNAQIAANRVLRVTEAFGPGSTPLIEGSKFACTLVNNAIKHGLTAAREELLPWFDEHLPTLAPYEEQ